MNCMVFGNCQHAIIEECLNLLDFNKYFNLIKTPEVTFKNYKLFTPENLKKINLFIYQNVSEEFDRYLNSKNILSLLPDNCIKIKIPNYYFEGLYPQNCKNQVVSINRKYSTNLSGMFPYGDKFIIEFLDTLNSPLFLKNKIIKFINLLLSEDFISKNEITKHFDLKLNLLKERETNQQLDILSTSFLSDYVNNFKYTDIPLSVSVNHPNRDYFIWLLKNIYKILDLKFDENKLKIIKPFYNHIQVPILPSVYKGLGIAFKNNQIRFYDKNITTFDYYIKYVEHLIGASKISNFLLNYDNQSNVIKQIGGVQIYRKNNLNSKIHKYEFANTKKFIKNNLVRRIFLAKNNEIWISNYCSKDISLLLQNIKFDGSGNILCLFNSNILEFCNIHFKGSNSYVYISKIIPNNLNLKITIENNSAIRISDNVKLFGEISFDILSEDFCLIGKNVLINTKCKFISINKQKKGIILGDNVRLENNCRIFSGTKIYKNSYIVQDCILVDKIINKTRVIY